MTKSSGQEMSYGGYPKEWVGYKPDIKVLDCTIRDGGLMNNHQFDDDLVKEVYRACAEGGIDYMEIGYKASKKIFVPQSKYGIWKFCDEDDIRRVVGDNPSDVKLSVMADADKTDYRTDILPKKSSAVHLVRVATYIHQIPSAINIIKDASDKGYETSCNIMAISTIRETELGGALELLMETPVKTIVVADSFGSLYSEQIKHLTNMYLNYAKEGGKEVGIHAHNNQQLAFANTIEALIAGATRLDATLAGLGRGAGNCPIELLVGFLHNPKYHLRPLICAAAEYIEPMHKKLGWGFSHAYMITGQLNRHPKAAMEFMDKKQNQRDIMSFLDSIDEQP